MGVRYSEHVRCANCRALVLRESATPLGAVMYGPCCWAALRSAAANGWPCADCGQVLPDEDMVTANCCRRCAGVPG